MRRFGFTLAELLIALLVLGVIATFTIPKVLNTQQSSKYNSIAKEAAGMMSEALLVEKALNGGGQILIEDIRQHVNYVSRTTVGTMDGNPGAGNISCSNASNRCYLLHNGAALAYGTLINCIDTTNPLSATAFFIDPDGVGDDAVDAVAFYIYNSGRLRTRETIETNTDLCTANTNLNPLASSDPTWFSWD